MNPTAKLVPYGILNVLTGLLTVFFGSSLETSDFIADCIESWWEANALDHIGIEELVINLDNGPNSSGRRTQFIKRMTEFSDKYGLKVRLIYYPPYHSKYNAIERCWGRLEEHWNGEILDSVDKAIEWAKTMTWKGTKPIIHLCQKIYKSGVKLTVKEMKQYENRIERSSSLPQWDITIEPLSG
jgi:transposase